MPLEFEKIDPYTFETKVRIHLLSLGVCECAGVCDVVAHSPPPPFLTYISCAHTLSLFIFPCVLQSLWHLVICKKQQVDANHVHILPMRPQRRS